jgi:cytochrome P450
LNANSIPIATWALFELVQDPALWKAVQEEAETAFETNPDTGDRELDIQKMLTLPRLQAVYVESLRLHVSVNVTREVIAESSPMAGYQLPKNALVQAPTWIAHHDEKAWGVDGHPASEFWASRNLTYPAAGDTGATNSKPTFVMRAGPNEFFPYGM